MIRIRFARLGLGLLAVAIATSSTFGTDSARAGGGRLELRGALTDTRIVGFGTITPPRPGERVLVRLLVPRDGDYREVARRRAESIGRRDSDGDGRRDSTFEASFRSRGASACKVVAVYRGGANGERARDSDTMPCRRPEFGDGTATMSSDSATTQIAVEIADTPELRSFGLMYKRRLGAERGMAFLFESDTSSAFWMKNTLIPLSIAFFDAAGTIVRIMDMEPCEADPCPLYDPEATYRGALEVNQGAFGQWGVEEGDTIAVAPDP